MDIVGVGKDDLVVCQMLAGVGEHAAGGDGLDGMRAEDRLVPR